MFTAMPIGNLRVRNHPRLLLIVLLGGGVLHPQALVHAGEGGLGISPGIILIEDAPVGTSLDLGARGLRISMTNGSAQEQVFGLTVVAPKPDEIRTYEAGFEPIPNVSWVHLGKSELTVAGHGGGSAGVTLDIPDRPELYNRHFMAFVDGGPWVKDQIGTVLHVRTRILLETAVSDGNEGLEHGGEIAVAPSRVNMQSGTGGIWSGQVRIRNNSTQEATYDLLTLQQAYGVGLENRRARFFGSGQTGLINQDWATSDAATFTLAPGAVHIVHVSAKPKRALKANERVDEVLFVARRAAEGLPAAQRRHLDDKDYARCELIRLTYSAALQDAARPIPSNKH
jgi:hypothetical protein